MTCFLLFAAVGGGLRISSKEDRGLRLQVDQLQMTVDSASLPRRRVEQAGRWVRWREGDVEVEWDELGWSGLICMGRDELGWYGAGWGWQGLVRSGFALPCLAWPGVDLGWLALGCTWYTRGLLGELQRVGRGDLGADWVGR